MAVGLRAHRGAIKAQPFNALQLQTKSCGRWHTCWAAFTEPRGHTVEKKPSVIQQSTPVHKIVNAS